MVVVREGAASCSFAGHQYIDPIGQPGGVEDPQLGAKVPDNKNNLGFMDLLFVSLN